LTLYAYTDGASRGNPGESGIGAVVRTETGSVVFKFQRHIGRATNTIAEYTALLELLERMREVPCTRLVIHSDSELMVRQLNGSYKVKDPELRRRYTRYVALRDALPFGIEIRHVTREQNREADQLANEGIDGGPGPEQAATQV
jgi:ribonuclease HI